MPQGNSIYDDFALPQFVQDINLGYDAPGHTVVPEPQALVGPNRGPNMSSIKIGRPPMPQPLSQSNPNLTKKQKRKALQDAMDQFWDRNA